MKKDLKVVETELVQSPTSLIEMALTNNADIQTIEKLVEMQNKFEAKEARKTFFASLSKFQSEMPSIGKNGNVDFKTQKGRTVYDFVRLEDIGKAVQKHLFDNGLSYRYEQSNENNKITVTCIITHKDGHSEQMSMTGMNDSSGNKNPIQQIGSTISYLKRYTLVGALGLIISEEDDDGMASSPQTSFINEYSNDDFKKNYPTWEKAIKDGNKTADQIIAFVNGKGLILQDWQITQLNKVGK